MQTAFGPDGVKDNVLAQHMQFQPIVDISTDGKTGWVRSRAFVMSNAGWGLPLYENAYAPSVVSVLGNEMVVSTEQ